MSKLGFVAAGLAAVVLVGCEAAPLTAPVGSTIFLQVNPPFVIANGGIAIVTAVVVEPAGTFVPDGTEVMFFTTLGRIDPVGKTVRGVANVNFVSDSRSGVATVTAFSGGTTITLPADPGLTVGSALPARVDVTCDPQRITTPRNCRLVATVFDSRGNPIQNVPVSFSFDESNQLLEETLDSGGASLYTNSNGQVADTLRTRAPEGLGQKTIFVNATAANGTIGKVTIFVD